MSCISGTPISDEWLIAILDGEVVDEQISEHLSVCPYCQKRFEDLKAGDDFIRVAMHFPAQALLDYSEGLSDPRQSAHIARHLRICVRCRQILDGIHSEEDELSWMKQIAPRDTQVAKIVAQIQPVSADYPRVAGVGGFEPVVIQVNAENVEIDLTILRGEQDYTINGLVSAMSAEEQAMWQNTTLTLRQAGAIKATALLNQHGRFQCSVSVNSLQANEGQISDVEIVIASNIEKRVVVVPINLPM